MNNKNLLIELHMLHPMAGPSVINTGMDGLPKSTGDRIRISSQCMKNALRENAAKLWHGQGLGVRTAYVHPLILNRIAENTGADGLSEDDMDALADFAVEVMTGSKVNGDNKKFSVMAFLSEAEVTAFANLALAMKEDILLLPDTKNKKPLLNKARAGVKKSAMDRWLAFFGRMMASLPENTIEGAISFSHAVTTTPIAPEVDDFIAHDDLSNAGDGAAMLSGQAFAPPSIFYRYIGIDVTLLSDHLGEQEAMAALTDFVRLLFVTPLGQAKSASMHSHEPPLMAVAVAPGPGQSMGSAFLSASRNTRGDQMEEDAINRLEQQLQARNRITGLGTRDAIASIATKPDLAGEFLTPTLVNTLADFIDSITKRLS